MWHMDLLSLAAILGGGKTRSVLGTRPKSSVQCARSADTPPLCVRNSQTTKNSHVNE